MKLRDLMATNVMTLAPDDGLLLAADQFLWAGIRHLPVVQDGRVVGVLSHRDLATFQALHTDADWKDVPVEKAMRKPAETAGPNDSLTEAAARMKEHKIGCLPITEQGKLIGLVTTTDILAAHVHQAMRPPDAGPRVADAMSRNPVTVRADDHLLDAAARMQKNEIRHLPVVDADGIVIGLLSDRDVRAAVGDPVRALASSQERVRLETTRVEHAMTREPLSVGPSESCAQVARYLAGVKGSALPVVDPKGKLLGMLSYVDLLRALAR
jgi:acetoin utilization protein AcuB